MADGVIVDVVDSEGAQEASWKRPGDMMNRMIFIAGIRVDWNAYRDQVRDSGVKNTNEAVRITFMHFRDALMKKCGSKMVREYEAFRDRRANEALKAKRIRDRKYDPVAAMAIAAASEPQKKKMTLADFESAARDLPPLTPANHTESVAWVWARVDTPLSEIDPATMPSQGCPAFLKMAKDPNLFPDFARMVAALRPNQKAMDAAESFQDDGTHDLAILAEMGEQARRIQDDGLNP